MKYYWDDKYVFQHIYNNIRESPAAGSTDRSFRQKFPARNNFYILNSIYSKVFSNFVIYLDYYG